MDTSFYVTTKTRIRKLLSRFGLRAKFLPSLRFLNSIFFKLFVRKPFVVFVEYPLHQIEQPYLLLKGYVLTNSKNPFSDFELNELETGRKIEIYLSENQSVKRNFSFQNSISFLSGFLGCAETFFTESDLEEKYMILISFRG